MLSLSNRNLFSHTVGAPDLLWNSSFIYKCFLTLPLFQTFSRHFYPRYCVFIQRSFICRPSHWIFLVLLSPQLLFLWFHFPLFFKIFTWFFSFTLMQRALHGDILSFLLLKKLIFSWWYFFRLNCIFFIAILQSVENEWPQFQSIPIHNLHQIDSLKEQQFKEWRTTNKSLWVTGQLMLSLFLSLSPSLELIWFG